jgi:hypothetical protein
METGQWKQGLVLFSITGQRKLLFNKREKGSFFKFQKEIFYLKFYDKDAVIDIFVQSINEYAFVSIESTNNWTMWNLRLSFLRASSKRRSLSCGEESYT